jgi:hypothetical protein
MTIGMLETIGFCRGSFGLLVSLAISTAAAIPATAQDSHYWTNQYGTGAQLLSGVVVGSILDLSSTYYNPGSSALTNDRTLVLTTSAAELISITVEDGAGDGKDLRSVRLAGAPSIFAIALSPADKRHKSAVSYLTRQDVNFEVDTRRVETVADPAQPAGDNVFAELNFTQRLSEPWAGVSWSYKANPHVGFGATMYTALRSHRGRLQTTAEGVDSDSTGAVLLGTNEYRYWNVRLLGKTGVFLDYDPLKAGLAITTPSLNLFGEGSTTVNGFSLGLDTDNDGILDANMVADYQDKLASTAESPFSIALGASYVIDRTALFATVESFGGIARYNVLSPEPFVAQSTGDTISYSYTQAAKAVTNWGVGVEHHLAGKTTLYGGFHHRSLRLRDRPREFPDHDGELGYLSPHPGGHLCLQHVGVHHGRKLLPGG